MRDDIGGPPPPATPAVPPPPVTPPPLPAPAPASPLSPSDERTIAMLAHLSVLLNVVTGFLGVIAALVIYIIYKDRSRYVAFQAMQSFIFQLAWWAGPGLIIGAIWAVTGVLASIVIGLVCIPFALLATLVLALMPLAALVYGLYAAVEVNQGKDFRYWLIGDWLRQQSFA